MDWLIMAFLFFLMNHLIYDNVYMKPKYQLPPVMDRLIMAFLFF